MGEFARSETMEQLYFLITDTIAQKSVPETYEKEKNSKKFWYLSEKTAKKLFYLFVRKLIIWIR